MSRNILQHVLRLSILLPVCIVLLSICAGAVVAVVQPTKYTATTRSFVSVASADTVGDLNAAGIFASSTVRSFADLATTPAVLEPVIEKLRLNTTTSQLATSISTSVDEDSVIITLSATSSGPAEAARIANAVASQLGDTAESLVPNVGASSSNLKVSQIQVAQPPSRPSSPNVPLILGLSALLGIAVALLVSRLQSQLDSVVRSEAAVRELHAGPVLGRVWDEPASRPMASTGMRAESYRSLRTNLQFLGAGVPPQAIVVTSSVGGEGKSTTTVNLAVVLAEAGERVLVIDADLRRSSIADYFGIDGSVGLTDVLIGRARMEQAVQEVGSGVRVLPAGTAAPNPSELLQSPRMRELLAKAVESYDLVLVDAPPVGLVTDAAIISRFVDGALFIVGLTKTKRHVIARAVEALGNVDARILGVVVNFVPPRSIAETSYYASKVGDSVPSKRGTSVSRSMERGRNLSLGDGSSK